LSGSLGGPNRQKLPPGPPVWVRVWLWVWVLRGIFVSINGTQPTLEELAGHTNLFDPRHLSQLADW